MTPSSAIDLTAGPFRVPLRPSAARYAHPGPNPPFLRVTVRLHNTDPGRNTMCKPMVRDTGGGYLLQRRAQALKRRLPTQTFCLLALLALLALFLPHRSSQLWLRRRHVVVIRATQPKGYTPPLLSSRNRLDEGSARCGLLAADHAPAVRCGRRGHRYDPSTSPQFPLTHACYHVHACMHASMHA